MAYHSTTGTANNTADMHAKLKDFLVTTCGWTLHDDQMGLAQPYFVVSSNGESGSEDIYLQFLNDSYSDIISVRAALYWNPMTHTPVKDAFYAQYTAFATRDSIAFLYWIYADLDHIFIVTKLASTYYAHYCGLIKRFWSGAVAITQAAVTAGSNVLVQMNDASIFTAGTYYMIKDNANIERVQITAADTGSTPNTITIANLVNGYASGAKIGEDPQPIIVGRTQSPGTFYALSRFDGWQSSSGQTGSCGAAHGGMNVYCDPDLRYGKVVMFPWLAAMTSSSYEELRGELIDVYAIGTAAGDSEDILDLGSSTYRIFNISSAGWCAVKE